MILKDELFNKHTVTIFVNDIISVFPSFDGESFTKEALIAFPKLELKERMSFIEVLLEKYLTCDFLDNTKILSEALKKAKQPMFIYGSALEYVEKNGCNDLFVDQSLKLLGEFTKAFSAEFAIRRFLNEFPAKALKEMLLLSTSSNVDQRRFASEGVRPRLPWAQNIDVDYHDAFKPLENLYYDKERYVTRSVANHLNDISKIDPLFVLETLERWKKSNKQKKSEMKYIIDHSLRTLVKKGHPETLEFLGFNLSPKIELSDLTLRPAKLKIGDTLNFSFEINSFENTSLIIDYIITYVTKINRRTSKTYKLKTLKVTKDTNYSIKSKRSFKPVSTRKMYKGVHKIDIQVNGKILISRDFDLLD